MIEQWILSKIEPLKPAPLIILRDPQRMIQAGAHVVDGWADENGYSVLFCTGNLALREMHAATCSDPDSRVLLVDRTREGARIPLFYPDLMAQADPQCQMSLSLRRFLIEKTGDPNWPPLADDRNLSRRILDHLLHVLCAHEQLRQISNSRFSDTDLYKIVLGATLHVNPFKKPSATEIRRLCIGRHHALEELNRVLPDEVMATLRNTVASTPKPFCWLLQRDPDLVIRAFTLAAIMRQHDLEYQLLLSNVDPALHEYREIDPEFLDQAMSEQLEVDPDQVSADVQDVERFLQDDPERLAFVLHDRLGIDDPEVAFRVLKRERLSPLIRGMAMVSLLADLLENKNLKVHTHVLELLDRQQQETTLAALRRPSEQLEALEAAYRRAIEVHRIAARLKRYRKQFMVATGEGLTYEEFHKIWNQEGFNLLDYYSSALERALRVGEILPVARNAFWPELDGRWERARAKLAKTIKQTGEVQDLIDRRFQDLYRLHYADWIHEDDAPVVFTHQFLPRMLKAHWDPQSGRKAVVMVFDGLRTDAWDQLLRPVFEERFELIESRPGSALIPTETHLSRKAISAGCLPNEFSSPRELNLLKHWLKEHLGLDLCFEVIQDDDTLASGMTVRYSSKPLEYIIFNFTDRNLHGNPQDLAFIYDTTVQEIIRQDVRSVLRELPEDSLVFVTSDHGFTPVPKPIVTVPNTTVVDFRDVKYRSALTTGHLDGEDSDKVIEFDARTMGIPARSESATSVPIRYVLFPRPGFTLRREKGPHRPDPYTHGGVSLAECLVPMVVMGPRRVEQPALSIESMQQVGSVIEGGALELEITVVAMRIALPDMSITLSFSRDEIPTRREVFSGTSKRFTVRWTPELGEITDEDRREEVVVQPVTVILSYREGEKTIRQSRTTNVRIKLDPARLRRRVDSKLDLLVGKVPRALKS